MLMTKLILRKYTRFRLNPIDEFELTITNPIQVILGTNGSGKSSIAAEWSFLPGNPADFKKGGAKIAEGSHNGSEYRTESHFGTSARFSFYKDGVALVDLGTATAVYECCRQEFGLTRDVLDLLQGQTRFTAMSPSKRKDWLMRLSNLDLTFLMQFYEQSKTSLRDTVGALKHVGKRLTDETSKLDALIIENDADDRIRRMSDELSALLLAHSNQSGTPQSSLKSLIEDIANISNRIMNTEVDFVYLWDQGITSIEDLADSVEEYTISLKTKKAAMTGIAEELERLYKNVELLRSAGSAGLQDIVTRLNALETERINTLAQVKQFDTIPNPVAVKDTLIGHQAFIIAAIKALPVYKPIYTPAQRSLIDDEYQATATQINKVEIQIERLMTRVDTLKQLHVVHCPNCTHEWQPGLRDGESIGALLTQIETRSKHLTELLKPRYAELVQQRNDIAQYDTLLMRVKSMISDLPELAVFWRDCIQTEFFYRTPEAIEVRLMAFLNDIDTHIKAANLESEMEQLRNTRAQLECIDNTDLEYCESRIAMLEGYYSQELTQHNLLSVTVETLKNAYSNLTTIERLNGELNIAIGKIGVTTDKAIAVLRDTHIDQLIQHHHSAIATLRQQVSTRDGLLDIVNHLKAQFDDLQTQQRGFKLIVEATSPSNGLIAEQLMGFIHCFVSQMNGIIAEFWNYDLQLLPCNGKNGELDYYFPFSIEGSQDTVVDIGKGSEAQIDLFDFAFRVIATGYLNLQDFPLYADELGRTFDEQHRHNLIGYIKRLMDARQFSQLVMISHYAANHSAMQNAEVCVLDSQNITMHDHYNRHVTIR